jgi:hypothetical protein
MAEQISILKIPAPSQEAQVLTVLWELLVLLDRQALREPQELQELLVILDRQALREPQELQDRQVLPVLAVLAVEVML